MSVKQRLEDALSRRDLRIDKNTVIYGYLPDLFLAPDASYPAPDGHGWVCGRCLLAAWDMSELDAARVTAVGHAHTHNGVRVVHEKG